MHELLAEKHADTVSIETLSRHDVPAGNLFGRSDRTRCATRQVTARDKYMTRSVGTQSISGCRQPPKAVGPERHIISVVQPSVWSAGVQAGDLKYLSAAFPA
jgi:hypothetical protein